MTSKRFSSPWRSLLCMLGTVPLPLGVVAHRSSAHAAERVNNIAVVHGGFVNGGALATVR